MVIRCKKPVEIETGSHCNDSTVFLHPLSKKSRCHFQSPNHGCKHRKQQTICHFSIFPARGRRSTKVKEASLMQITLVVELHSKGTQRQFSENICSEDDLRSTIFGTFVVKFLACLLLLGFSNI